MSPAAMRGGRCRLARFPLSREWKYGGGNGSGGRKWKGRAGMEGGGGRRPAATSLTTFHSGERRNLCGHRRFRRLATILCSDGAENSRGRENDIPAFAGMEGGRRNGIFLFDFALGLFFTHRRLTTRGKTSMIFGVSPHSNHSLCEFYPTPQAAEGESMT